MDERAEVQRYPSGKMEGTKLGNSPAPYSSLLFHPPCPGMV
jgi:hypothetical protein